MAKRLILRIVSRVMVVLLYSVSWIIPLSWGYRLCELLGGITCRVLPKYRRIAMDNLKLAFGEEMTEAERGAVCRGMFVHLVKNLYEFFLFPRLSKDDIVSMVSFDGSRVRELTASGKGAVMLTAHFGNWELLGARVVAEGFELTVIGKDMHDEWMTRLMIRLRSSTGVKNLKKGKGVFKPVTKALGRNELVGLLADQNAGAEGIYRNFFGVPASVFTGPAVFAAVSGAVIIPIFCIRNHDDSHKVVMYDPICMTNKDNTAEIDNYLDKYTECMEKIIRKHPEQWLWLHKRWDVNAESVREIGSNFRVTRAG